jgi:hypothetical protein
MSRPRDGGPAFPVPLEFRKDGETDREGMTLRDWFAGQAVNGLLSCWKDYAEFMQVDSGHFADVNPAAMPDSFWAERAYRIADAMLAERQK